MKEALAFLVLGIVAAVVMTLLALLINAWPSSANSLEEGHRRSLDRGAECLAQAKLADTAVQRLDEAMRCGDLHPGTIRLEDLMRLQYEAILEVSVQ